MLLLSFRARVTQILTFDLFLSLQDLRSYNFRSFLFGGSTNKIFLYLNISLHTVFSDQKSVKPNIALDTKSFWNKNQFQLQLLGVGVNLVFPLEEEEG